MKTSITIPLEEFPESGMHLSGEADSALLGLGDGSIRCNGPIHYELEATLYDTEMVVRGMVEAPFIMRCDRCLEEFPYTVQVAGLTLSFERGDAPTLDITDELREELILALPAYPKCELTGKECQIHDINDDFRLDKVPPSGVDCATPSGKSVWQALDQFPAQETP